jgi:murein DD-endopeptidase MepM/ murein hydrolase activator NlpD
MNALAKVFGLLFAVAMLFACGGGAEHSSISAYGSGAIAQRMKILSANVANSGLRYPVAFSIQQGYEWLQDTGAAYGCSAGKVFHPGVDINKSGTSGNNDKGEPLYAIADGEVVYADDANWASLIIRFSFAGKDYYAVYGHSEINSGSSDVTAFQLEKRVTEPNYQAPTFESPYVGMQVTRGQVVGLLWNHNTENAHLHFEIRSSDHPSPSNGTSFCGYYGGKTKDQIRNINRDPLGFVVSNGYIDGICRMLDSKEAVGAFCWTSNPVGQNVSCEQGANHVQYTVSSNRALWIVAGFDQNAVNWYCSHLSSDVVNIKSYLGRADSVVGGDEGGWPGAGYIVGATDDLPDPPDFVTKRVWLQTPWGTEVYKFGLGENFDTKAQAANIGEGSCPTRTDEPTTITGRFYLSKGYKEDAHSGTDAWRRIDSTTTQCDNLKPGDTNTETKNISRKSLD